MLMPNLHALEWWDVDVVGDRYVTVKNPGHIVEPMDLRGMDVIIDGYGYRVVNVDAENVKRPYPPDLNFTLMVSSKDIE